MAKRKVKIISKKKKKNSTNKILLIIISAILIIAGFLIFGGKKIVQKKRKNEFYQSIPSGFLSVGIDVSHHQGKINWEELFFKNNYDSIIHFVYCKATEGNTHFDKQWEMNRKWLNDNGIPNGAYHFFISKDPPKPQAEHFLKYWHKRDVDLPPVLDVEMEGFSDIDLIEKMKIWLNEIENQTGMRPIIYTSLHFYETKFQNEFKDYKFWIAAYSRKPECIEDERIIHWQYTESARIPGTKEKVDVNVSKLKIW
jgi:lysozyme